MLKLKSCSNINEEIMELVQRLKQLHLVEVDKKKVELLLKPQLKL